MMWACDPALTSTILQSYQVAGPAFVQAMQSFFAAQCALVGDHVWPEDATDAVISDPNYDFIVVGAGSAGSVVANRLSEMSDWKILLVEAGGNPTLTTEVPQLFYSNMNTNEDWGYKTQPEQGACRSYRTKGCAWPRGKTLGGSSSINAMFYVRGNKIDYDEWYANGNIGWSYQDVLPYFKKSEKLIDDIPEEMQKYHGDSGYFNIGLGENLHLFEDLILKAAVELGLSNLTDINGSNQMGVTRPLFNIKNGIRYSTARAFLNTAKQRNNLHIIKNAYATKILFQPGTNDVSGVLVNKDGKDIVVNIKKELIVSGGTINSPQLLMLSGIGPKNHLKEVGIEVKADLPVGESLEDHVFVPIFYTMPGDKDITSLTNIINIFAQAVLHNKGPLSDTSPHRIVAFANTTDPNSTSPDMQYHFIIFPPSIYNLLDFMQKHDLNDEIQKKFRIMNENKFTMFVYSTLLKPKSKGKIFLKSKDPFEHPLIFANYFDHPEDIKTLVRGLRQHALKLGDTKAFKEFGFKLDWLDIDACIGFEKASDQFLECMCREITFSLYHPTSTVKMGPDSDPTAVVDPELRVRKVNNLRVIDGSIMPSVVRGNTNAACIMIGEKGAEMIKSYWLSNSRHTEL